MKIFVTGATGFVGSHLVDALLARGDDVCCLVRDPAKMEHLFAGRLPASVTGDLSDAETLQAGCRQADLVFHVAAATAARNREAFFRTNVEGTRHVIEAATRAAPGLRRFVFVSSQAASGPSRRGETRIETDTPQPVSAYGESKLAAEDVVRQGGLPWTIVRPTSVYGPRDTAFLKLFKFARAGIVPLIGDAEQELSLVHVQDLVAGLLAAAAADDTRAKVYFVCHSEVVTAEDLVRHLYDAVKGQRRGRRPSPLLVRIPAWAARATLHGTGALARLAGKPSLLNPDKANELLADAWTCTPAAIERDTGWRAQTSLPAGARNTARWYREHGWL